MSDQIEGILQKKRTACLRCNKVIDGFFIPDGRFICPNCDPLPVYQRWERAWAPHEKAFLKQQEQERLQAEALAKKLREDEKFTRVVRQEPAEAVAAERVLREQLMEESKQARAAEVARERERTIRPEVVLHSIGTTGIEVLTIFLTLDLIGYFVLCCANLAAGVSPITVIIACVLGVGALAAALSLCSSVRTLIIVLKQLHPEPKD